MHSCTDEKSPYHKLFIVHLKIIFIVENTVTVWPQDTCKVIYIAMKGGKYFLFSRPTKINPRLHRSLQVREQRTKKDTVYLTDLLGVRNRWIYA